MGDDSNVELGNDFKSIEPSIHSFTSQHSQLVDSKRMDNLPTSPSYQDCKMELISPHNSSKPHLIIVPHEDQNGHQKEILQEVFLYPKGSIQTVIEKSSANSLLGDKVGENMSTNGKQRRRCRKKKLGKLNGSQSSLGSANSTVSSKSESSLVVSGRGSEISKTNSNNSLSVLATSTSMHMQRNKFLERCENEVMSDTSSNISTLSDLSGYEDEYTTIKRIISDAPNRHHNNVISVETVNKKSCIESRLQEQDRSIRSLNAYKEDLEIQVHRLSVQLQNAVREKDILQEQLDMMQTKLTEKNQKEFFQLLKEKANLEGQYEVLMQQYESCSSDRNALDNKLKQLLSTEKLRQEEYVSQRELENSLKETIEGLRRENVHLEGSLHNAKENLNIHVLRSSSLETESKEQQKYVQELLAEVSSYKNEIEICKQNNENLSKKYHECLKIVDSERQEKKQLEKLLQESDMKLNATKENNDWCQAQLLTAQKLQSDLQAQLAEVKSSLAVISTDRDRCKREVEKLSREIEENRARAVREKSSLLTHLEELEADMREREASIRKLEEGEQVHHVKLSEERFKRLEEDHKKLQKMRIEMGDIIRENDSLTEDRKHKNLIIRKLEEKLHDLRKDFAMTKEKLGEKKVLISSLSSQLAEAKSKLESTFKNTKERDSQILDLKEDKSKLEAALRTANEYKEQVDETISKLREDMSKLSSNFYRMKHDLSAKDKQIESLSKENLLLVNSKKELQLQVTKLSSDSKPLEEYQSLLTENNKLKAMVEESNNYQMLCDQKLNELNQACEALEIEKKSLKNEMHLRDEQIENLNAGLDVYKEKLLQKDEEIYNKKDLLNKLERNLIDLQNKYTLATADVQVFEQEKEEFVELEKCLKKSINELKENFKLEKRSKDAYERKFKEISLELASAKAKLDDNMKILGKYEISNKELENFKSDNVRHEEEIKRLNLEIEKLRGVLYTKEKDIQSCNLNLEEGNKELVKSKEHFEAANNAKCLEITELQKVVAANNLEITRLKQLGGKKEEKVVAANNLEITRLKQLGGKKEEKVVAANNLEITRLKQLGGKKEEKVVAANNLENTRFKNLEGKKEGSNLFSEQVKRDTLTLNRNRNSNINIDRGMEKNIQRKATRYNNKIKGETNKELEDLKNKYKDILLQLSNKNKEVTSLQGKIASANNLVSTNQLIVQEIGEMREQIEALSCKCNELQFDLNESKAVCISKEQQCNEWKEKYEGLCDFIPQRDTDFQQGVNWDIMQSGNDVTSAKRLHRLFSNSAGCEMKGDGTEAFDSLAPAPNFEEKVKFTQTMADLQTQVALTAEALQTKDRQIIELNEQLSSYQPHSPISTFQKTTEITEFNHSVDSSIRTVNVPNSTTAEGRKPIDNTLNCCEVSTMTLENADYLSLLLSEKENEVVELVSKLNTKETEFREKQRRYESNVRLLTRKLKEHMKGRRASEKDLELMTQENSRKLEAQERQYQSLKSRYIDLEKKCRCMESQNAALEGSQKETNLALSNTEKELKSQQLSFLQMQKEVGQLEELKKYGDNLKYQLSALNDEVRVQKISLKEKSDSIEILLKEQKVLEEKCSSLTSGKDDLTKRLTHSESLVAEKDSQLESTTKLFEKKCEQITSLKEELSVFETKCKDLEDSSRVQYSKAEDNYKEILNLRENIQTLNSSLELKNDVLTDYANKINILEGRLKIIEESLEDVKGERNVLLCQMKETENNHLSTINHLNSQLIEAQKIESSLNEKINEILNEKISYQSQTTELKAALNVALCQLKKLKSHSTIFTRKLPSPAPLDTESLSKLMEKCSNPPPANRYLSSLSKRLSSLREEVSALQGKIKSRDEECEKSD